MTVGNRSRSWRFWCFTVLQLIVIARFFSLIFFESPERSTAISNNDEQKIFTPVDNFHWPNNKFTESCFYVEDLCHSSQRLFYRKRDPTKKQPTVFFNLTHDSFHWDASYPRTVYKIEPGPANITEKCSNSPITNHIILFSIYNDMLGEFYDRSLLFLWRLSQQVQWVLKDSQLYIHVFDFYKTMMDSHHLFTSPFRTQPLLDFKSLVEETHCACLPRAIFCGYIKRNTSQGVVLEPGADQFFGVELGGTLRRDLRNYLWKKLIEENPYVRKDIELLRHRWLENIDVSERHQWKIVGLAQRQLRRRWRNLAEQMSNVQIKVKDKKILLVEINLEEKTSNAYQQLVRHGAIDALIGIHGAQLTQAIFMKPNSWVVELLPYLPDQLFYGTWTRTTDTPTPLGVIWDNTDLNHVGYPLVRDNAPYCLDKDVESNLPCWRSEQWDYRDFQIDDWLLEKILTTFITEKTPLVCQDILAKAGKDFVLYNVNCRENEGADVTPHHYYWSTKK